MLKIFSSSLKPLKYFRLTFIFALIIFAIMFFTMSLTFFGTHMLAELGLIGGDELKRFPLFIFSLASIMIGTVLALIFSKAPLRPLRELMAATDRIADGDYSVRLSLKKPTEFSELSRKFNHMAEELGSVEMLRTDFINNFSHEFKTPIVSIRGFAKALKWEDLSDEERNEYLDIIISESERLSELSLNVLYLSKIEKQAILTDKSRYNLSEQIRLVVALLYQKISSKNLELVFDSEEYYINANAEMLKQVWINLLDNAVKFSPDGAAVRISIEESDTQLSVSISDQGIGMPAEVQAHIFDKFYQADRSHSCSGNGLGLTIVKKIVELHAGSISVSSSSSGSTFEVLLNK